MDQLLRTFLGIDRWKQLFDSLRKQGQESLRPTIPPVFLFSAIVLAVAPVISTFVDQLRPVGSPASVLPTVSFGICSILALMCRRRFVIAKTSPLSWRESLSLTHTAVALGCLPVVVVFLLSNSFLADRHDVLVEVTASARQSPSAVSPLIKFAWIVGIAAWVALTEELIFRGLLVSAIRRTDLFSSQLAKDRAAIVVSAMLFGLAHWPTWGFLPAIALTGLGCGFVLGYIANGERLGPLVLYHFVFDVLSLSIGLR